MLTIVNVFVK